VASKDYPDPRAGWFRRNRHWLALTVWVFLLLGGVEGLLTEGADGVVGFAVRAAFFGLFCWSWGSRRDRNRPSFWRKFIAGWSVLLVVWVSLSTVAVARGTFAPASLVTFVFVGLLLLQSVLAYRRTRRGLTWNWQPAGT